MTSTWRCSPGGARGPLQGGAELPGRRRPLRRGRAARGGEAVSADGLRAPAGGDPRPVPRRAGPRHALPGAEPGSYVWTFFSSSTTCAIATRGARGSPATSPGPDPATWSPPFPACRSTTARSASSSRRTSSSPTRTTSTRPPTSRRSAKLVRVARCACSTHRHLLRAPPAISDLRRRLAAEASTARCGESATSFSAVRNSAGPRGRRGAGSFR